MPTKVCTKCKSEKDLSGFNRLSCAKDGYAHRCKKCVAEYKRELHFRNRDENLNKRKVNRGKYKRQESEYSKRYREEHKEEKRIKARRSTLKVKFNLTLEKYIEMSIAQGHKCAICGEPETVIDRQSDRPKSLAVDHDHVTNKIRGLLCNNCNRALGLLKDNIKVLQNAVTYLQKWEVYD